MMLEKRGIKQETKQTNEVPSQKKQDFGAILVAVNLFLSLKLQNILANHNMSYMIVLSKQRKILPFSFVFS